MQKLVEIVVLDIADGVVSPLRGGNARRIRVEQRAQDIWES